MAGLLGILSSLSGLLQLARVAPDPESAAVWILSVDGSARRGGRSYAPPSSILNANARLTSWTGEDRRVLLPGCPQIQGLRSLSRGRAKEYVHGGWQGAPDTIQVTNCLYLARIASAATDELLQGRRRQQRSRRARPSSGWLSVARPEITSYILGLTGLRPSRFSCTSAISRIAGTRAAIPSLSSCQRSSSRESSLPLSRSPCLA